MPLVSISDAQRAPLPFARLARAPSTTACRATSTPSTRSPTATSPSSAAFRRRRASTVRSSIARRRGCRSRSRPRSTADQEYFEQRDRAAAGRHRWSSSSARSATREERVPGRALALLFPIDWPEPFGLVMIEAIACGTPGHRLPPRLGARGDRRRGDRLHRRSLRRGGGCARRPVPHGPRGSAAPSSNRVHGASAWPTTTWRCTGSCSEALRGRPGASGVTPEVDQYYILAELARPPRRRPGCSSTATPSRSSTARATSCTAGLGEQGLYHQGTRFLSRSSCGSNGRRPLLLSSTVRDGNALLTVDLTNPDLVDG